MRLLHFSKGGTLAILLLLAMGLFAQQHGGGIQFCVNLQQANEFAQAINRPVFVVVERPYNCSGCLQMEQVYASPAVERHFNGSFANLKVSTNSPDGVKLVTEYNLRRYPAYLFFNKSGKLTNQAAGVLNANELIAKSNSAFNDFPSVSPIGNPYDGYLDIQKQHKSGATSPDVVRGFCLQAKRYNNKDYKNALKGYINSGALNRVSSVSDLEFLMAFIDDYDTGVFDLIVNNLQAFKNHYGADYVHAQAKKALLINVKKAASQRNRSTFAQLLQAPAHIGLPDEVLFELEMLEVYYGIVRDWSSYAGEATRRLSSGRHHAANYNKAARNFARYINNQNQLETALFWAKAAVDAAPYEYVYRETYAALLYKTDKKGKALKEAELAKRTADSQGKNYVSTLHLINAINGNLPLPSNF